MILRKNSRLFLHHKEKDDIFLENIKNHFFWIRKEIKSKMSSTPPIRWSEYGFREGDLLGRKSAYGYFNELFDLSPLTAQQ